MCCCSPATHSSYWTVKVNWTEISHIIQFWQPSRCVSFAPPPQSFSLVCASIMWYLQGTAGSKSFIWNKRTGGSRRIRVESFDLHVWGSKVRIKKARQTIAIVSKGEKQNLFYPCADSRRSFSKCLDRVSIHKWISLNVPPLFFLFIFFFYAINNDNFYLGSVNKHSRRGEFKAVLAGCCYV